MISNPVHSDDDMRRQRLNQGAFEKRDHWVKWRGERCGWKAFFIVLFCLQLSSMAGDVADEHAWRVWLDPKSMHAAASTPIGGAKRTLIAGGYRGEDDLMAFSKEEFASLNLEWDGFVAKARTNCASDLALLKPHYVRNRKKVIVYAELTSDQPVVASAVLAPKFLDLFADTLGPKVLVVVPNQFTAYVFPALVSDYQDYEPMVRQAFGATAHPVSMEVLEFSAEGIKAVGIYGS